MARREGISDVSNLAMWMTSDWRVCVCIYGSQTGGGKKGGWQKGKRENLLVVTRWEVEGVVAAEILVVTRLGSLAEAMEARGVGSCLNGKSTICSTAGVFWGSRKDEKWSSGSATK